MIIDVAPGQRGEAAAYEVWGPNTRDWPVGIILRFSDTSMCIWDGEVSRTGVPIWRVLKDLEIPPGHTLEEDIEYVQTLMRMVEELDK